MLEVFSSELLELKRPILELLVDSLVDLPVKVDVCLHCERSC